MSRSDFSIAAGGLRLMVVIGLFFISVYVPGIHAQPANPSEQSSTTPVVVTNLLQLSKLLNSTPRVIADVRLDAIVCSTSRPEMGVMVVKDGTGSEVLELGPRRGSIAVGDIIHLEAQRCLFRRREIGIEITRSPDLDNDATHGPRTVAAEIRLAAGLHAFQLDYFNYMGSFGVDLTCKFPDGTVKRGEHFLVKPSSGGGVESNLVAGLDATYYEGTWLDLPNFALLQPLKAVATTNLDTTLGPTREMFGVRFKGFFSAPVDGTYAFKLSSDDGSMLFLDSPEIPLKTIGHEEVPLPTISSLHAPLVDSAAPEWMSVEGRVVFVSRSGRGLRFELRSQPDYIWVAVADAGNLDPMRLLNSRIRIAGVGRSVMAPNRVRVLGQLSVATSDDITILEGGTAGVTATSGALVSPLTAVGQIQSLSKEEAARHLPVRIQGVVTSIAPSSFRFMSVQDETRGIFVRLSSTAKSFAGVGQFCMVIGHTDAGDFAPIVVADELVSLGGGQMPVPARPTWRELINGSMDVQWVELQGVVTAAHSNSLDLLLPEGDIKVEIEAYPESKLKALESAVIRLRGVLFAAWNTNRTVQVGRLVMRNVIIDVDIPAPRDPFDVSLKNWSELYQFDSRATSFQRVKVRGAVIYSDARGIFLMDKGRGIRVSPFIPTKVQFGEMVEVVGYPDIGGAAPLLREAILRKIGDTNDLQPLNLDSGELMQENLDSRLVRITATLMGIHSEPDTRVLEMSAHGQLFLARLPSTKESASLRVGSRLALTGVYVGKATTWAEDRRPGGFELLLSSPAQMTVLSQPSWWTPRRLLVTVGLLLAILVLAAVWISQLHRLVERRTQQLQQETREREVAERERALETERSRIARDLHDDLGSSLTEISVLASKGQRAGTVDDLAALFRGISAKARGLVTALDVIVWAVDPKDNSLESVADYLGDFASEYLAHSGISCRFDIPVALPPIVLEGRLRHGLLLAVKETLNNVERHAQATEVEFRMAIADDQLEIVISDNGIGFDPTTKHRGNGLINLPLRLSKLGGRYDVKSARGNGTIVTIELRLPARTQTMRANASA